MLGEWLIKISDYGHAALSKGVHHFGVLVGIGGGAATHVAGQAVDSAQSPMMAFVLEYGGLVTLIAGISLVIKNISDVVLSWVKAHWDRKDKRDNT